MMQDTAWAPLVGSLRDFFMECPFLREGSFHIDYLGPQPGEYSLDTVPGNPIVRRYLDGSSLKQFIFVFASREEYGAGLGQALDGHQFYERLAGWMEERNRQKKLPLLEGERRALSITALSTGGILQAAPGAARYQLKGRLVYLEKGGR